jgi:hypothetical protein
MFTEGAAIASMGSGWPSLPRLPSLSLTDPEMALMVKL